MMKLIYSISLTQTTASTNLPPSLLFSVQIMVTAVGDILESRQQPLISFSSMIAASERRSASQFNGLDNRGREAYDVRCLFALT